MIALWPGGLMIFRTVVIAADETNLVASFGEEYASYKQCT